jgi:ribonuclease D
VPDRIDTAEALAAFLQEVRSAPTVAVDTEAASFHRYRDRIYLVQLSTGARTAVVDPLAATDLTPLGAFLADPTVEKVFHDADYDLRILDRDYGFRARRVFDTRIAAQLAGEPAIGLAALLERYVGVVLAKVHQKGDWSQRPLPAGMITYAADDVRHLPTLRAALADRLRALGRLAWAEEEFERLEHLRWTGPVDQDGAYLRAKGAQRLAPRQLAALRELWGWRHRVAEREDRALFRIVGNEALLAVARALPTDAAALSRVRELPASLASRFGAALLAAVDQALRVADADLPRLERARRAPRDQGFEDRLERVKEARNAAAERLGIDAGVLLGRAALEAVARTRPTNRADLARLAELRRWQVDLLGEALLSALG